MSGLPSGTVTFLFSDIEGSTRIWEAHPEAMRVALVRHDELIRTAIDQHDGHVFKTIGDAFCAVFRTAPDALNAALEAQLALVSEPWPSPIQLKVRMALHTGTAEVHDNDYFGQPLNRVARLLAAGHGGQVLLTLATEELVRDALTLSASLQALGEHRLRDLNRPETVFQLQHPGLPVNFPPLKSLDQFPNNLPQQLTSFIGREREIAQVKSLLEKGRLLTLTGSGGCGKSRLSLQVVAYVLEQYPDGVWLTELAPVADPGLVPQEVASALGLIEQPGKTFVQTLTDYLKSKRLLLVLDNCEHLLSACAQLCNALLRSCSNLTILASSREGLGIAGEQTYRVPSLTSPDLKQQLTVEQISQYEAVRLFIERATNTKSDFAVTNQSAPALAAVCHRLDGIPLAIELAAARIRSLSVEEIDSRLEYRFRLLTGGSRAAVPRHQTLRALIDWSYDLLTDQERLLLGWLSVFAGGWTLVAAEQVGTGVSSAGEEIEDWQVLDLLTSLVDKSLVIVETQGQATRYRLLETVRQYGWERLLESGEAKKVQARHRDYFLKVAEEAEPKLTGSEQREWLEVLETEHDNLRQAIAFCLEETEGTEAGLRLGTALWRFWGVRGHWGEGRERLAAVLDRAVRPEQRLVGAHALHGAATLAWIQGDYAAARALNEQSLAIRRELRDKWGMATSLNNLGVVALYQGDFAAARALPEEGLAIFRELGDKRGSANSLNILGNAAYAQGDYATARALQEESLPIFRELGDRWGLAHCLDTLCNVAYVQGDFAAARALQEESLAIYRALGDKWGIGTSLRNLGVVVLHQGDYAAARALLEESLAIRWELGDKGGVTGSVDALADLAYQKQQARRAAQLWGAATCLREAIGSPRPPVEQKKYEQQSEQARAALGESAFDAAFEQGRAMTFEQAVEYALGEE
jgi:predicted ATPase/class 3 adenylate cyclase